MTMKKILGRNKTTVVAAMLILALMLASCGTKQTAQETTAQAAEAAQEDQAAEAQEAEAAEVQAAEEPAKVEAVTEAEEVQETAEAEEAEEEAEAVAGSEDGGFTVKYPAEYQAQWLHEGYNLGGLRIYTGEPEQIPFVAISRIPDSEDIDLNDAEDALYDGILEDTAYQAMEFGLFPEDAEEVQVYEFGGKQMTGTTVYLSGEDGKTYNQLVLLMLAEDSKAGEEHYIRFTALYEADNEEDKDAILEVIGAAAGDFKLDHMYEEESEVKPGNYLLDFCNSDSLRVWFDKSLRRLPSELTYMEDTWYSIDDPDTIRSVLEALKTVKIGDVSDEHVGASGRRTFDFYSEYGGEGPSFAFFENTFEWEEESYEVLDWGDLLDIELKE